VLNPVLNPIYLSSPLRDPQSHLAFGDLIALAFIYIYRSDSDPSFLGVTSAEYSYRGKVHLTSKRSSKRGGNDFFLTLLDFSLKPSKRRY
jgi:hypothetical protein